MTSKAQRVEKSAEPLQRQGPDPNEINNTFVFSEPIMYLTSHSIVSGDKQVHGTTESGLDPPQVFSSDKSGIHSLSYRCCIHNISDHPSRQQCPNCGQPSSLFKQLKQRSVFKVTTAYVVMAWVAMQVADVVLNNVGAPDWIFKILMLLFFIGLPFVVIFAWVFEITPEGVKREQDINRSHTVTRKKRRTLNFIIIIMLIVGIISFHAKLSVESNSASPVITSPSNNSSSLAPMDNQSADVKIKQFILEQCTIELPRVCNDRPQKSLR